MRRKRFPMKKRIAFKKKICRFCSDDTFSLSYRDFNALRYFISERGKIIPRRISGNCAKHQRFVAKAIKRARVVSIVPFTVTSA